MYQEIIWINHPQLFMGELYTVTYRLFAPSSWVSLFLFYFLEACKSAIENTYHAVAPNYEAGLLL